MSNLFQLRLSAREIFNEALRAVNSETAVRNAVRLENSSLNVCGVEFHNEKIYSIAIGKAALPMGYALEEALRGSLNAGVLAGPRSQLSDEAWVLASQWRWFAGGHPLPNKRSVDAGDQALELLERANKEVALVLFLISGGGSAMMESPINGRITLANLRMANKALISSGAAISEVNAVRRAFSAVKGGKLAARALNCQQLTLIVSDVPKGAEYDVASGPTLTPPADSPTALEVIDRYGLRSQMPPPIMQAIDDSATPGPAQTQDQPYFVLLDNDSALDAAASAGRERGLAVEVARDISDEPIESGCEKLLTRLTGVRTPVQDIAGKVCLLSGGEFACPVRGKGIGGRNLETALRLAIEAEERRDQIGEFVGLCAGTDGIDGNSPAAGAIVDSTTLERAHRIGLDPMDSLKRSDSYSFFVALGDAITTGPTGTNVRDLRILLAGRM